MADAGGERRFRVESLAADDRGTLAVSAEVARHIKVLRLDLGAEVLVFDGRGGEARAELLSVADDGASLKIVAAVRRDTESPLRITVVQAVPVRAERMETIVRQLTELGIQRLVPMVTERSRQARAGTGWGRKIERWQRIADSAAEQSGRVVVPRIDDPVAFGQLDWNELPRPLWIAHPSVPSLSSDSTTAADAAAAGSAAATGAVASAVSEASAEPAFANALAAATAMVGPEGGWTQQEFEDACEQGAATLALGPRILRSDTAGAVAVAVLQYRWGDLGDA